MKPIEIEFLMKDKLTAGLDKAGKAAVSMGEQITLSQEELKKRIQETRDAIKHIEQDLEKLEKQKSNAVPGEEWMKFTAEIQGCKKALDEELRTLSDLESQVDKTAGTGKRLSMQLREMYEEMAQMRLNGQQDTARYRELEQAAANLADTLGDVRTQTNILAHDNAGLQGVMSGVSGFTGVFTAATGVVSLFASENENLIKIQTRVQSVMAITMGMQQAMNALNKDSAFRLVTVVKFKKLLTAANVKLATALGISNAAASALMATLTLGLSAAITGVIYLINRYSAAKEKAAEKALELVEIEKDGRATMLKTRVEINNTMREIKRFTGTRDEEKAKIEELNRQYGETFGYYKTLSEWYDVLQQKSEDYIKILFLQAKAQSYIKKAVESDEKVNEIKAKGKEEFRPLTGAGGKLSQFLGLGTHDAQGSDPAALAYKAALEEAEKERDSLLDAAEWLEKEIADIRKQNGIGGFVAKSGDKKESDSASLAEMELKAEMKIREQYLALRAEGYDKERAQAVLAFEQEKQRINKEEKERLELYEKLRKAGKDVKPEEKQQIQYQAGLQRVNAAGIYDKTIAGINNREAEEKKESFLKLIEPYSDFAQQKLQIEEEFNRDIKKLRDQAELTTDVETLELIRMALAEAEEAKSKVLEDLDRVFAEKDEHFQVLMSHIANMSLRQLEKALEDAEKALSASTVSNGKNSNESIKLRATITALKEEIRYARAENELKAPDDAEKWRKNRDSIRKCKAQIDGMLDSMSFLDEATQSALKAASNVADGAIAMVDGIQTLALGAAESIKAAEKASVILAIVGAAVKIITGIFSLASSAEKRHQEALAEVATAKLAMQREYNLLLLQQNLLLKDAESIFGEQSILKAANAIDVYRDALSGYYEELKGNAPKQTFYELLTGDIQGTYKRRLEEYERGIGALSDLTVKTGHKKTGLFGWGKGQDIYSSVLDVYPDLIDAENRLNVERAKTILSTQTMSDENKALLQSLIELHEQAEEALDSLREYLHETFGGLGDGIMDALSDAIIDKGTNAWEIFGTKGSEVIENLGKQLTYSLYFAEKFNKLQQQLESIYGSGRTEEQIARDSMALIGDFYQGIGSTMESAQAFMEQWQAEAKKYGFDPWSNDNSYTQSGRSGAFQTMSQDSANKLEGMMTAQNIHIANMDDKLGAIGGGIHEMGSYLSTIAENTLGCKRIGEIADTLQYMKNNGVKMV